MPEEQLPLISYATSPGAKNRYVTPTKSTWPEIVERVSRARVVPSDQKANTELVFAGTFGGESDAHGRVLRKGSLLTRSMITLDIDDCDLSFDDIEERVIMGWDGCYSLYTTFSHRGKGRVRIFIPMSREVTADEYKAFAPKVARELDLLDYCDPCSWRPSEGMFVHATDEEGKAYRRNGEMLDGAFWPVPEVVEGAVDRGSDRAVNDGTDALEEETRRYSFSEEQVDDLLERYDPEHLHYDQWLEVGAALNWRYSGSDEGFDKWVEWSSRGSKHNISGMSGKWKSFDPNSARATTLATIVMRVKESSVSAVLRELNDDAKDKGEEKPKNKKGTKEGELLTVVDLLVNKAKVMSSDEDHREVLCSILKLNGNYIIDSNIDRLANAISKSPYGIEEGISKVAARNTVKHQLGIKIKRDETPGGIEMEPDESGEGVVVSFPSWCKPWVFIGSKTKFYNIHTNTIYPREAFDILYGKMPELKFSDLTPSRAAVQELGVPTVDAMGFNPLAPILYETEEGQTMANTNNKEDRDVMRTPKKWVNTYQPYKLEEASDEVMRTPEAQAVIDRFLWHTKYIIGDDRQEALLIDWLAHNVKTPGKKINWAIVLQGIYGTGKTYFFNLLEAMLGPYAKAVANKTLTSHFTGWATGSLVVCIDELRMSGQNRYEIVDTLKPYISNPTVAIEAKGENSIHVPNFTNYLAFTNHKDAVPVDRGERRYCILFSRVESEDQMRKELVERLNDLGICPSEGDKPERVYFDMLFADLQDNPGVLLRFFKDRQYSEHFSPRGAAPMTEAKKLMMELTKPTYQSQMEEYIDEYHCEVINEHIVDLYELKERCPSIESTIIRRQQAAALTALGYVHLAGKAQHKVLGKWHVIYVKNVDEVGGSNAALEICRKFAGEEDISDMF